jgi:Domain of Unknown Function (DUF928)
MIMIQIQRAIALILVNSILFGSSVAAIAAPTPTRIRFKAPALPTPPNLGSPSGPGAGRRGCPFTVLVPTVQSGEATAQWGVTTAAQPTFWVQLPNKLASNAIAELQLFDDTNTPIQRTQFPLVNGTDQVASFAMPTTVPPLKPNTLYRWTVTVYCDPGINPSGEATADFVTLEGGIQRVSLPQAVQKQLAAAKTPLEKTQIYANNGVWFDALTTLGKEAQTKPSPAIARAWLDLLAQENFKSVPKISKCCKPK